MDYFPLDSKKDQQGDPKAYAILRACLKRQSSRKDQSIVSEESAPYVVKSEILQKLAEFADGLESDGRYMLQLSDLTPEALSAVAATKLAIAAQTRELLANIQHLSEKGASEEAE